MVNTLSCKVMINKGDANRTTVLIHYIQQVVPTNTRPRVFLLCYQTLFYYNFVTIKNVTIFILSTSKWNTNSKTCWLFSFNQYYCCVLSFLFLIVKCSKAQYVVGARWLPTTTAKTRVKEH